MDIPYKNELFAINNNIITIEKNLIKKYYKKAFKIAQNTDKDYPDLRAENHWTNTQMQNFINGWLKLNKSSNSQNVFLKLLIEQALLYRQKVYIVLSPYRTDTLKQLPTSHELFNNLFNLLLKYPEIKIINLYDDKDFIFEDFSDFDHLNKNGAEKATKKITMEINK